jgi:OOP family OmpA-OmpF porin
MTTDIVELIKSYVTSLLVTQVSTRLDETEADVSKVLHKSVVLVLHSLLKRLKDGFAPDVLLKMVRAADAAQVLRQLSYPTKQGASMLSDLVGTTHRALEQEVALGTSIRPASSGPLLHVAATAVAGVLGQEAKESNPTPLEFANWLGAQHSAIDSALLKIAIQTALAARPKTAPSPVDEPLAGPSQMPETPLATAEAPSPPAWHNEPTSSPSVYSWLRWQWGLLLLVALGVGYFLGNAWLG